MFTITPALNLKHDFVSDKYELTQAVVKSNDKANGRIVKHTLLVNPSVDLTYKR